MKIGLMFVNSGPFSQPELLAHLAVTAEKCGVDGGPALLKFLLVEALKAFQERRIMRAHVAFRGKHLVEKIAGFVFIKQGHERKRENWMGYESLLVKGE